MPLIFGLLVILNAVFLAWQFFLHQNNSDPAHIELDKNAKSLQLLSETGVQTPVGDARDNTAKSDDQPVLRSSGGVQCLRVGPVTSPEQLSQLQGAFSNLGFGVKAEDLTQENTSFWVFIPPQVSGAKAESIKSELKARGYHADLVTDGQYANAVSLGEFSDRDKADTLKDRLVSAGFPAETRKSPIIKRQQWLRVTLPGPSARAQVDRVIAGSNMRKEPAPCE